MIEITWKPRALKQLRKLKDPVGQRRIVAAVGGLGKFPDVANVKALMNHDYDYRLRVGDFRVLFNLFESIEVASIEEVKKRNERTY
jgi:mRNA-degrading endonuclease RelE of RelBE toxin-antitoxin system